MNTVPTMSPTSIKTFQTCPWQYHERYISKTLKFTGSPATERGGKVHKLLEDALVKGLKAVKWPRVESVVKKNVEKTLQLFYKLRGEGWEVNVEKEIAITEGGHSCGWWDKEAWLRCKLDVHAVAPDQSSVLVCDWKTGQVRPDPVQLHINALCSSAVTGIEKNLVSFLYVDQGVTVSEEVNVSPDKTTEIKQTMALIDKLAEAHMSGDFPAKRGPLCKFCAVENCPVR